MSVEPAATTWPWPPEVPRPPYTPPSPGERPETVPSPRPPMPTLPTWEEPVPSWRGDVTDRLLDQRIVLVAGELDDALANVVAAQLLLLDSRNSRPITMHLSCNRSELGASIALADVVDLVRGPVRGVARGTVSGPALAVFCACEQRDSHRHTQFVLSLPHVDADGTARHVANVAAQHEHQFSRVRDRIAAVTGQAADRVQADLLDGRLLTAQQAKDYGMVTQLL
jgi:ATP-dependent Clp protease protease subunit